MKKVHEELEPAFVEFIFRVHADGRRERIATVYARDEAGALRPVRGALGGAVGEFAAHAVAESAGVASPSSRRRRVSIDERRVSGGRGARR